MEITNMLIGNQIIIKGKNKYLKDFVRKLMDCSYPFQYTGSIINGCCLSVIFEDDFIRVDETSTHGMGIFYYFYLPDQEDILWDMLDIRFNLNRLEYERDRLINKKREFLRKIGSSLDIDELTDQYITEIDLKKYRKAKSKLFFLRNKEDRKIINKFTNKDVELYMKDNKIAGNFPEYANICNKITTLDKYIKYLKNK